MTKITTPVPAIAIPGQSGFFTGPPWWLVVLCCIGAVGMQVGAREPPVRSDASRLGKADASATARSLEFLSREMSEWPRENGCYSCHNNGDAARAIYLAMRMERFPLGRTVSDSWLKEPSGWQLPDEEKGPEGDQSLADLQFALAAERWAEVARHQDRDPEAVAEVGQVMAEARSRVRRGLVEETHWPADPTSELGSPVTYGPRLGTAMARQLLGPGETAATRQVWRRSRDWLLSQPLRGTMDAAARILGLTPEERLQFAEPVQESRQLLWKAQQDQGGWGPYERSRPENFDTAIALLALMQLSDEESLQRARKGREYLLGQQWEDGSWTETTRPGGRESYAQRISTVAWVTIALLASESLEGALEQTP